jgi:hypothetical protein
VAHAYLCFVPIPKGGYRVSFLHDDATTTYPRKFTVEDSLMLARVAARMNGNVAELRRVLAGWGQGSVTIHPTKVQVAWLEQRRS